MAKASFLSLPQAIEEADIKLETYIDELYGQKDYPFETVYFLCENKLYSKAFHEKEKLLGHNAECDSQNIIKCDVNQEGKIFYVSINLNEIPDEYNILPIRKYFDSQR